MTIPSMFAPSYFVSMLFLFVKCLEQMVDVIEVETLGVVRVQEHHNRPHRMIQLKTMKQTPSMECLDVSLTQPSHLEIILVASTSNHICSYLFLVWVWTCHTRCISCKIQVGIHLSNLIILTSVALPLFHSIINNLALLAHMTTVIRLLVSLECQATQSKMKGQEKIDKVLYLIVRLQTQIIIFIWNLMVISKFIINFLHH